jgi:hypothetical protein
MPPWGRDKDFVEEVVLRKHFRARHQGREHEFAVSYPLAWHLLGRWLHTRGVLLAAFKLVGIVTIPAPRAQFPTLQ